MGLHLVGGFVSEQVAVGGSREDGTYLEFFAKGSVETVSGLVRKAAAQTGGILAVARNPVTAAYTRKHAAPGAIRRCLAVGRAILAGKARAADRAGTPGTAGTVDRKESAAAAVEAAARASGGRVVSRGTVVQKDLETAGGFDVGRVVVEGDGLLELTFCNEYLTLEALSLPPRGSVDPGRAVRLATFPDLIVTMDLLTGRPVSSAELDAEQEIAVVVVPQRNLILGAGVRDRKLYADVERLAGKEIVRYAFA
jgi:hypothetical protein